MNITIEIKVDKEKTNEDFDLKTLLKTIQAFDRNNLRIVNVVSSND